MSYLIEVTIVSQLCTFVMQSLVFCTNKISAQCSSAPSQWSVASTRQTQSSLQFLLPHKQSSKEIVIVIIRQSNLKSQQNYVFQGPLLTKECFFQKFYLYVCRQHSRENHSNSQKAHQLGQYRCRNNFEINFENHPPFGKTSPKEVFLL